MPSSIFLDVACWKFLVGAVPGLEVSVLVGSQKAAMAVLRSHVHVVAGC